MPSIQELNTKLQRLTQEAKDHYAAMEAKSEKGTKAYDGQDADITKHTKMIDDGVATKAEIDRLLKQEELYDFALGANTAAKNADGKSGGYARKERKASMASLLLDEYKDKNLKALAKSGLEFEVDLQAKALNELTPAAGGALVWTERLDEIVSVPQRPLSILNLLRRRPTSLPMIEYRQKDSFVNNAAIVPELGLKPESTHTWSKKTANLIKVAHWERYSEEIFDDVPQLQAIVNQDLVEGVLQRLEELVTSHNVPTEMVGILNVAGSARVHRTASNGLGTATDNVFDTIRYAIADLQMKFYRADSIILNPILAAKIDTDKDSNGRYIMSYDPVVRRMWNLRVAESAGTLIPGTTAIVMDSTMGPVLLDRQVQSLRTVYVNDQAIRNEFTIIAEGRYGLMTQYPDALEKITGF